MSTELGGPVPVPPAVQDKRPEHTLCKAHYDLNSSALVYVRLLYKTHTWSRSVIQATPFHDSACSMLLR
jgi:hypothetical protein